MALTKPPLSMLDTSAGVGYQAGDGGTVTQLTNKSTAVTLNKLCGQITMNNAALAAGASVFFILNNSQIGTYDQLICNAFFGAQSDAYVVNVNHSGGGFATIRVTNVTGASRSDALPLQFAVIKSVIA